MIKGADKGSVVVAWDIEDDIKKVEKKISRWWRNLWGSPKWPRNLFENYKYKKGCLRLLYHERFKMHKVLSAT